jgi:hypothetical protein
MMIKTNLFHPAKKKIIPYEKNQAVTTLRYSLRACHVNSKTLHQFEAEKETKEAPDFINALYGIVPAGEKTGFTAT